MIRKKLIRSLSALMAVMLSVMTVACGQSTVSNEAENAIEASTGTFEETEIEKSIIKTSGVSGAEAVADKVETVYVSADANGAVNDVVVSEWLKNASSSTALSDKTELKDIVNVKGPETYSDNGDGTLTWNAGGSDIYYQGTTNKALPVDMKITYFLDGKEISPEEIAGKSGKVTIKFDYQNKDRQSVNVDGREIEVYTPFAMVSGMMLDSEKFSNVEISNGKVISDGGNIIVMGVAMPGLKESLDIADDKWDEIDEENEIRDKLSGSFEITADTTDFEMGMTVTMASSDLLSDFGMSDLTGSDRIDELKDDMNELNDGSDELVDGTRKLKDGTTEFVDGTRKLYDGATELSDGTQKLYDGTDSLLSGTGELYDGVSKLYDGIGAYTDGTVKIKDGAVTLAKGIASAKSGSAALKKGMDDAKLIDNAKALADGSKELSAGMDQLGAAIGGLSKAMGAVADLKNMYNQIDAAENYLTGASNEWTSDVSAGFYILTRDLEETITTPEQVVKLKRGVQAASSGEKAVGDATEKLTTFVKTMAQNNDENVVTVSTETLINTDEEDAPEVIEETEDRAEDNDSEITSEPAEISVEAPDEEALKEEEISELTMEEEEETVTESLDDEDAEDDAELMAVNEDGNIVLTPEQYQELAGYVTALATGNGYWSAGMKGVGAYYQLLGAAQAAKATLSQVLSGVQGMSIDKDSVARIQALVEGAKTISEGNSKLSAGLESLYNGTAQLDSGLSQLKSGADKLADGSKTLTSRNDELMDGTGKLRDGVNELNDGAYELNDGARQLNDGTHELMDGTKELYDGATELDDGVKELLDGVIKFDEEGIKKLYEAFDGDLSDFSDRLTAIEEAGKTYTSFGGSDENVDSSVKFIIKTDSIKSL